MKPVFVYGSLKENFTNHGVLRDAKLLGCYNLNGYNLYTLGPFPAIQEGEGYVIGELYQVDQRTLDSLDQLEGHPVMYTRTPTIVTDVKTGESIEAYVYVYQGMVSEEERLGSEWCHSHVTRYKQSLRNPVV